MVTEKKPKVLMIGPARSVHGGISGVVNNYYDAGLDRMVKLCYIATMVEGSKIKKLLQALKAYLLFLVRLSAYDIVHVNMASDSSYYRKSLFIRTAHFFHKKIIIHQHGGNFEEFYHKELSESGRRRVQKVLSMGDVFLVLGSAWKSFFATLIEEGKIIVFPDSIRIPQQIEKQYGLHKILFLGRLCKAKGIEELLAVMPALQKQYADVHLYLGGIWEDAKLKNKAAALSAYVTDLGWISGEEKKRYLQECDIFVLPSYFEGQSVSILEAMAYACAVAASKTGGIPEMITDDVTGLFVRPQDTQTLEKVLLRLLGDANLCSRLGQCARKKAENEFSIEDNMAKLLKIYEGLMQEA
ncbi:MAG: glycosyltransferase family 4 protein [Roseburia sp.]|nr:glycosyltransferase family 4 protein [Roseburia sp.]MCM1241601.1 glycosyltransferase family 4 protein [Roseburia sp.]